MISNEEWKRHLEYVEWRAADILHSVISFNRGKLDSISMAVAVEEVVSKLLEDIQRELYPQREAERVDEE